MRPNAHVCMEDATLRLRECIVEALNIYEERLKSELRAGIIDALDVYEERLRVQVLRDSPAPSNPTPKADANTAWAIKCELCGQSFETGSPDMSAAVQAAVASSGVGVMCGLCGKRCAMPGIKAFNNVDLQPVPGKIDGQESEVAGNGHVTSSQPSSPVAGFGLGAEHAVFAVPRCFEAEATGKPIVHLLPTPANSSHIVQEDDHPPEKEQKPESNSFKEAVEVLQSSMQRPSKTLSPRAERSGDETASANWLSVGPVHSTKSGSKAEAKSPDGQRGSATLSPRSVVPFQTVATVVKNFMPASKDDLRRYSSSFTTSLDMERVKQQKTVSANCVVTNAIKNRKVREMQLKNPRFLYRLVNSHRFEYFFGCIIFANAIFLGIKADYRASHPEDEAMPPYRIADIAFLTIFCIELSLRVAGQRWEFFTKPGIRVWNLFDFCVVILPVVEELFRAFLPDLVAAQETRSASSSLRILRLLKNVRIIRMVRLMRVFQELRLMLTSIFGAIKSLLWALVLLFLIMWVFAVFFIEGACDYLMDHPSEREEMNEWYGSLGTALFTLFMSICGGVDWGDPAYSMLQAGTHFLVAYAGFIAFTQFAVLNIVTGIFLEHATTTCARDLDHVIQEHINARESLRRDIIELFREGDDDNSGDLTLDEFDEYLKDDRVRSFFAMLELDVPGARDFFQVLDQDGSGIVDMDEFVDGCMRLRGNPKSVDVVNTLRSTEQLSAKTNQLLHAVDQMRQQSSGSRAQAHSSKRSPPAPAPVKEESEPAPTTATFSAVTRRSLVK